MKNVLILLIIIPSFFFGQVPYSKTYSKAINLYYGQKFIADILGVDTTLTKVKISPLAAANAGELTTFTYNCKQRKKSGLILGFWGDFNNEYGLRFKKYDFKDFTSEEAEIFFKKFDNALKSVDSDSFTFFKFDEITVIIEYFGNSAAFLRLYWKEYNAEWDYIAYKKTKKSYFKKVD